MKKALIKFFIFIILVITMLAIYGRFINPGMLKVKEIPIYNDNLPTDYNGLKIVHFSDIHYGRTINEDELKNIISKLNELNADMVIFTGDLFDSKNIDDNDKELMINNLKDIKAKLFKYAIIGDYDATYLDTYKEILDKANFKLLDNKNDLLYCNSIIPINIVGLTNTDNIDSLYDNDYFTITIMHKPHLIKNINKSNLVFAGHSLGGQIRIPFIGGIKNNSNYIDNYYKVDNKELYISNGLGTQDLSFRTFNTPSITLYRLYNN